MPKKIKQTNFKQIIPTTQLKNQLKKYLKQSMFQWLMTISANKQNVSHLIDLYLKYYFGKDFIEIDFNNNTNNNNP